MSLFEVVNVDGHLVRRQLVPADVSKIALARAMRAIGLDGQLSGEGNPAMWGIFKAALAAADEKTSEDWELATRIPRADAAVQAFATGAGVTGDTLDRLFYAASLIEAGEV